jgi:hypothetical protein
MAGAQTAAKPADSSQNDFLINPSPKTILIWARATEKPRWLPAKNGSFLPFSGASLLLGNIQVAEENGL